MSNDPSQPHSKSDEELVKYLRDALLVIRAARQSAGSSEAELSEIDRDIARFIEYRLPTAEQSEFMKFAHRLATRQGTVMPNFDALHKQRAQLDKNLRGRDVP